VRGVDRGDELVSLLDLLARRRDVDLAPDPVLGEPPGEVFGGTPGRDVTRWFSDASALTRYGIPTVNYGTSTGLMDVEKGENLEIDGLVKTAEVYARVAMEVCGVA